MMKGIDLYLCSAVFELGVEGGPGSSTAHLCEVCLCQLLVTYCTASREAKMKGRWAVPLRGYSSSAA